jgi:hypothetical protein
VTTENKIVVSLKQYIARHDLARRTSRTMKPPKSRRHMREDVGDVGVLALTGARRCEPRAAGVACSSPVRQCR